MGPAPKPESTRRRRNAASTATRLPAEGREGEPPAWPLDRANAAERNLWSELWSTPQAVAWEALGWDRVVARYCRMLVLAEKRDASAALLTECRQLEDRLGLNPMSMLRLRWEIVDDELAEKREPSSESLRQRLKPVE
jgi:hypothetical protein